MRLFIMLLASVLLIACGSPSSESLQESFVRQIESIPTVYNLKYDKDELTFFGPGDGKSDTAWHISIDLAVVESNDDETMPFRGIIQSSWYANGQLIKPTGNFSHLPVVYLDVGVGQECWAFWEEATGQWDW